MAPRAARSEIRRRSGSVILAVAVLVSAACSSGSGPPAGATSGSPRTTAAEPASRDASAQETGRRPRRAAHRKGGVQGGEPKGWFDIACGTSQTLLRRTLRGNWSGRGPNLSLISHRGNPFGDFTFSTTHSGPWNFLQRVPLLLYGPGFIRPRGHLRLGREVTLADVVPTLAGLMGTPAPSSAVGRPIRSALLPNSRRSNDLRLIVTVVWDGGGSNVLRKWDESWPFLASLADRGTLVANATVGSSPSVTPAVHATLGTGAFPNRHGIVNITQRDNGLLTGSFESLSPDHLEAKTLADVWDRRTNNRAKIGLVAKDGLHLGMMGHGAYLPGGDHDIAAITGAGAAPWSPGTNELWYALPGYMLTVPGVDTAAATVDRDDGKLDGRWMGHDLPADFVAEPGFNKTPVETLYQTKVSKVLLTNEGFGEDRVTDMFFTNYKDVDYMGHAYNFFKPEVRETIGYADAELRELVRFVNARVGKKRWVLVFTADHGQAPLPQAVGDWPIDVAELTDDLGRFADQPAAELVQHVKQTGVWVDRGLLSSAGLDLRDMANFLLDYRIEDNAGDRHVPKAYRDRLRERIFDAVLPSSQLRRALSCAESASSG
ncbi:MAG: alkaline phosphatase family protein [Actinomycetota bacterium]|nr:alkaline phosphatase family protein [Actinomycetota bacterium]